LVSWISLIISFRIIFSIWVLLRSKAWFWKEFSFSFSIEVVVENQLFLLREVLSFRFCFNLVLKIF
jgi:hypothetical protein